MNVLRCRKMNQIQNLSMLSFRLPTNLRGLLQIKQLLYVPRTMPPWMSLLDCVASSTPGPNSLRSGWFDSLSKEPALLFSSEPQRYSIYMTDDTNDVDTELPPIDKSRTVRECGFGLLALVEKPERVARVNGYVVTVYTVSGHKFVFELNTLAKSLGWLRDEALKKRREVSDTRSSNMRQTVYELQTLESDEPLNLFKTISSTGVLEFLMIRKNSNNSWPVNMPPIIKAPAVTSIH